MRNPVPSPKEPSAQAHSEPGRKALMADPVLNPDELLSLARLFAYPESVAEAESPAPVAAGTELPARSTLPPAATLSLENEYVRLFINALPEVPCPPYGSVYLEGSLMSSSTVRLRRIYWSYGFDSVEMPDHISVELEFLAVLAALGEQAESREDYLEILDHLRSWTPEFFRRVDQHDRTGYYRQAAARATRLLFPELGEARRDDPL